MPRARARPSDGPETSPAGARPVTLTEWGDFVGRAAPLRIIGDAFSRGARLVTLCGPAGIGKTRMARHFAALDPARRKKARFIDLTVCRSEADFRRTLGQALRADVRRRRGGGVSPSPLHSALSALGDAIVVLDNFEQLAGQAGELLLPILRTVPDLCLLVTSRELLLLSGEVAVELDGLELPQGRSLEALIQSEAGRLFLARARSAEPAFELSEEKVAMVSRLLERLQGVPLAIELAAAQVTELSVSALHGQVERSLISLCSDRRDTDSRHHSLTAAIEWSWELLAESERRALVAVSAFRGGFTLDLVGEVLPEPDARAAILALRRKSLLRARPAESAGAANRFDLFESVREFAAASPEFADVAREARRRHWRIFAEKARTWTEQLRSTETIEPLDEIRADADNLVQAARSAAADGEWAAAAVIALALHIQLLECGPADVHDEILGASVEGLPSELARRVLLARADAKLLRGDHQTAAECLQRAEDSAEADGDMEALIEIGRIRSELCERDGCRREARQHLERTLELAEAHGDESRIGRILARLGTVLSELGELERAEVLLERAVSILGALEHHRGESEALFFLGHLYVRQRRLDALAAVEQRGLRLTGRTGHRDMQGKMRMNGAVARHDAGDPRGALVEYAEILRIFEGCGRRFSRAIVHAMSGAAHLELDEIELAAASLERSYALLAPFDKRAKGLVLLFRIALEAGRDRTILAENLLAELEASINPHDDPLGWQTAELARARIELARANRDFAARNDVRARSLLDAARRRLRQAAVEGGVTHLSEDARIMARLVSAALPEEGAPAAVRIAADGSWFEVAPGQRTDLTERPVLARVLGALARASGPLGVNDLVGAAWPAEDLLEESGPQRVRAAIKRLRRLGLGDAIVTVPERGYRLDAAVVAESA